MREAMYLNFIQIPEVIAYISDALRDLIPLVHFKKRQKHP